MPRFLHFLPFSSPEISELSSRAFLESRNSADEKSWMPKRIHILGNMTIIFDCLDEWMNIHLYIYQFEMDTSFNYCDEGLLKISNICEWNKSTISFISFTVGSFWCLYTAGEDIHFTGLRCKMYLLIWERYNFFQRNGLQFFQ